VDGGKETTIDTIKVFLGDKELRVEMADIKNRKMESTILIIGKDEWVLSIENIFFISITKHK